MPKIVISGIDYRVAISEDTTGQTDLIVFSAYEQDLFLSNGLLKYSGIIRLLSVSPVLSPNVHLFHLFYLFHY